MDIAFIIPAVSMYRRDVSILILSADTIRMSADILIAFENILIVFTILIERIAKRLVFVVRKKGVISVRRYSR
ncbi:hypothetical protein FHS60_000016 [Alloprevotella rava]|uniref:Uncharacterized protein n=1 Tax=Alloprevotella rava TaxID=671218 RepID=A0A7W5YCV3_9BACT|nr:hypothetical protein [Alloprevotella rava]